MYGPTICDLYSNSRFDIRDVIIPAMAGETPIPNLNLIPSDPTFEKIIEQTLTRSHREKNPGRHLEKVRGEYDYIIIDCARGSISQPAMPFSLPTMFLFLSTAGVFA